MDSSKRKNEILFNAVRLDFDSTSAREISRSEIRGRKDAWSMFSLWEKQLNEFSDTHFVTSGPTVGSRESRIVKGEYTLTADDVFNSRLFTDAIAKGSWYMDAHPQNEIGYHEHIPVKAYDIPYRTLLPANAENLLVAGRCHSATPEALASSRVNITVMSMGQAAGVAAAMAARDSTLPQKVNIPRLQRKLLKQGQKNREDGKLTLIGLALQYRSTIPWGLQDGRTKSWSNWLRKACREPFRRDKEREKNPLVRNS